jgi:hypothetical protein
MHVSAHTSTGSVVVTVWDEIVYVFALEPILEFPFEALLSFCLVTLHSILLVHKLVYWVS